MKVEIHILTRDESLIIGYALRHYRTFASKIVLHDSFSTDGTREIAKMYGAEIRDWDTGGHLNDALAKNLKENCWARTDSDWVGVVDADELLYFPQGSLESLEQYDVDGVPVVKPHGWEMTSFEMPSGDGQIYDEIKQGARDDRWYAKPVLFSPHRVAKIEFSAGAHECWPTLKNGRRLDNPTKRTTPPCYLLHYHQIGSIERIAEKYDATKRRLAPINLKHSWGWLGEGLVHAKAKRAAILKNLEQVIP